MSDTILLVVSLFCFALGIPMVRWPQEMARLNEMIDAIGRKPSGPVEPADWHVTVTRFIGIGLTVGGGIALISLLV